MTDVGAVAAFPVRDGFGAGQITGIGVCAPAGQSGVSADQADEGFHDWRDF